MLLEKTLPETTAILPKRMGTNPIDCPRETWMTRHNGSWLPISICLGSHSLPYQNMTKACFWTLRRYWSPGRLPPHRFRRSHCLEIHPEKLPSISTHRLGQICQTARGSHDLRVFCCIQEMTEVSRHYFDSTN